MQTLIILYIIYSILIVRRILTHPHIGTESPSYPQVRDILLSNGILR